MPRSSASPIPVLRRGVVLLSALLTLAVAAPGASAASGRVEGEAADAPPNEAPSKALDVVSANAAFSRTTGSMRATVQMAAKPQGDVDVQFGTTQPGGACATELTLRTNVVKKTAQLYGNAGNVRKNGSLNYTEVGTITTKVSDEALAGKKNIDCFAVRVYGAGASHTLRDSLGPVPMAERATTPPTTECAADDPTCLPPETCLPEDPACNPPVCTTEAECPTDPCSPGDVPTTGTDPGTGEIPVTGYSATSGGAVRTQGAGDVGDGCPPPDDGPDGGAAPDISVRFYGIPKRLRRGRSYDVRIRLRNGGDADARSLKVRLARKTGVAMSRRVASVSNVRSGKGITVHVRVRLTSAQAKRTIRVSISGADVDVQRSFVLRRRGAR
ncbi:hypothetical protein [Patulibacter minatonensis]|uniref:hypothetical protein n=1 Tax=Patulibacter minatonensis TaxID=298163 RepID=UPI00047A4B25|nr:hypothetical protein [Patulibacter minatonensis]